MQLDFKTRKKGRRKEKISEFGENNHICFKKHNFLCDYSNAKCSGVCNITDVFIKKLIDVRNITETKTNSSSLIGNTTFCPTV